MNLPRWSCAVASGALAGLLAWAAWQPVRFESREELFDIPKGTWARRMSGDKIEILPSEIRLVAGIRDVLVLRNLDTVPQIFGPTLIMPGQTFRLPFEVASDYQFACTAHASGLMTIHVDEEPRSAVARLRWRARHWWARWSRRGPGSSA